MCDNRMFMKRYSYFLLLLFLHLQSSGQISVGQFNDQLSYRRFFSVAVADDCVYGAAENGLMLVDKADLSTSTWSKIDGLSDVSIAKITYSKAHETLIVVYNNSNLDFIKDGKLFNVPDIKNKSFSGSKAIYNTLCDQDVLYLSTAFGVVLIDLNTRYVLDTWFTNYDTITCSVLDLAIFEGSYYIATNEGLFTIRTDDLNPADFSRWNLIDDPALENVFMLQPFKDKLFALKKNNETPNEILFLKDNIWQEETTIGRSYIVSMDATEDELLICDYNIVQSFDADLNLNYWQKWTDRGCFASDAKLDQDGSVWVADKQNGLYAIRVRDYYAQEFQHGGPHSDKTAGMDYFNGLLASVPGALNGWAKSYNPPALNLHEHNQWKYYTQGYTDFHPHTSDFLNVAINPRNPDELFVGSWGFGLFQMKNGEIVNHYDETNTPLQADNNSSTLVLGLCYDQYNNLWITNSQVSHLLKVLKSDGEWASFSLAPYVYGGNGVIAEHVLVDSRNYKWITVPRSNQLIVFSDNHTIDNRSDDEIRSINMNGDANVNTLSITCIAEDNRGEIWIGTDQGIKVIYNPGSVFTNTIYPQNILLEQMGYVQNLLEFEYITAIAVDGANRKWIGTSKAGVFLMSANGTEELLHFTADNSPLFSDQILSIEIDHSNGEVFISTANGLISYMGTATKGGEEHADELKIYPNPVREGYNGQITVDGLMDNSFCKIVDAAGTLVWQDYATGGRLVWNGKDFYGNRPATGVYFVFASDESGKKKKTGKILFIN